MDAILQVLIFITNVAIDPNILIAGIAAGAILLATLEQCRRVRIRRMFFWGRSRALDRRWQDEANVE